MAKNKKNPLQEMEEKTREETSRKMDDKTFNELFEADELSLLLIDGGIELTPQQMKKVKERAKEQQEEKLQQMAMDLAMTPGYQEMVTMPLISKIMGGAFKQNTARKEEPQEPVKQTTPVSDKQETKEPVSKKDASHTTINSGPSRRLKSGESESDVLAKIFNFMHEQYEFEKKKTKADKKYRKQLDNQKDDFLDETISALTGKKVSKIKKAGRTIRKSGIGKYLGMGIAGLGMFALAEKALAKVDWNAMLPEFMKSEKPEDLIGESEDFTGARKSAEEYLGGKMSDKEWDSLLRATAAEATNNSTEQAMVMGTILNRAKKRFGGGEGSITKALEEPNQFQAVTGTKFNRGPSAKYKAGPSEAEKKSIAFGAINVLPGVSKEQEFFAAESSSAYGPGTSTGLRDTLREKGGSVVGGTRFNTAPPTSNATITSGYGTRQAPTAGASTHHEGVDIKGKQGDTVVSTGDGLISAVGKSRSYGNYIEVDHGNNIKTRYAHLSKMDVHAGDSVKKGQKIGEVGSTGISSGPHLHYEILKDNKKIDPTNAALQFSPVQRASIQPADSKLASTDQMFKDMMNMKKVNSVGNGGTVISTNNTNVVNKGTTVMLTSADNDDTSPLIKKQFNQVR